MDDPRQDQWAATSRRSEKEKPGPWLDATQAHAPMLCAVLAFVGALRMQVHDQHARSRTVEARMTASLHAGVARVRLPLSPQLDSSMSLDIEAPRDVWLFQGSSAEQRLLPRACVEAHCSYRVEGRAAAPRAQLLGARFESSGRYALRLVQHTAFGDVLERVSLHILPGRRTGGAREEGAPQR